MDVFEGWQDYVQKLEKNWRAVVSEEDTVVIAGDISWAMRLEETEKDFAFIHSLPGKKWLLKGNHDYWWSTRKKIDAFLAEKGFDSIGVIHNSAVLADGMALCGTRGWLYNAESDEDVKIVNREVGRLNASIDDGIRQGGDLAHTLCHVGQTAGGQGQAVQHYVAHAAPGSVQVALVCLQNLVTGGNQRHGHGLQRGVFRVGIGQRQRHFCALGGLQNFLCGHGEPPLLVACKAGAHRLALNDIVQHLGVGTVGDDHVHARGGGTLGGDDFC